MLSSLIVGAGIVAGTGEMEIVAGMVVVEGAFDAEVVAELSIDRVLMEKKKCEVTR